MKTTLFILLLLILPPYLNSQTDSSHVHHSIKQESDSTFYSKNGSFLLLPFEIPIIETKEVDQLLRASGLPTLDYSPVNIGFASVIYADQFIMEMGYITTIGQTRQDDYVLDLSYYSFYFNFGYDLIKNYNYSIFPYIGFKGGGTDYKCSEIEGENQDFQDFLNEDYRHVFWKFNRAHVDLGLGFSYQKFIRLSFRTGMLFPLGEGTWTINSNPTIFTNDSNTLTNTPDLNYKFYFNFSIGLGG